MTIEERFERIEYLTVGMAEERRKDREEYKELWRSTQTHLDNLSRHVEELAVETRNRIQEVDERLGARIEALAEESRAANQRLEAADQRLGARIELLVSAMGAFLSQQPGQGGLQ
jgi:hypothetical protein